MWTHKAWPVPGKLGKLESYAGWCNAVEGNTTFYATPSRETVATWAEQTGPDFRFVIKLPKAVTHERRLSGTDEIVRAFLHAMEPLGPRRHALWLQLPGSFGPADVATLGRFLGTLPGDFRYAVEVRHPDFFTDRREAERLENLLERAGVEWVPFDTVHFFAKPPTSDGEREAWMKKPRMPHRDRALTDAPIIRYLGRDDAAETAEGWQPWVEKAAEWLREGRSPTVFVHTPDNVEAPELNRRFHAEVAARVPGLEPLPEPVPVEEPLTLF
jgi:uncharacterized protein YecE (DUF72 family)